MQKDIKEYRDKELKTFVFGNILLILLETGLIHTIIEPLSMNDVWTAVAKFFDSSVFSALLYIFVFVIDSIFPGKNKDNFVWLIAGLPGKRIFTEIKEHNRDDRFTTKTALIAYDLVYKRIDSEKDENERAKIQNEYWYRLYQKYENHAQVYISQRDYLLCRDMTVMMLWIILGYVFLSMHNNMYISCNLIIILLIEFLVVWISAVFKGERFSYNVLAKDLANYNAEEKHSIIV